MAATTQTPAPVSTVKTIETRLFIGGEFVPAAEGGLIPVYNPHDNTLIAKVAEATPPDIDRAIDAARKAFPAWKRMAAADRGRLILKLADAIEADAPYLSELVNPLNPDTEMGPLTSASHRDRVCQEEVFGPFVSVTRFKDEAEVIEIANSTEYGLGGGL